MRCTLSSRRTRPAARHWITRLWPSALAGLAFGLPLLTATTAARASETITYSYDARGRLKTVSHSGTVNNGKTTTYSLDKADYRTSKSTN
jgi:YD repeat-containing protein